MAQAESLESFCDRLRLVSPPGLVGEKIEDLKDVFAKAKEKIAEEDDKVALEAMMILSRVKTLWLTYPDNDVFGMLLERFFDEEDNDTRLFVMKALANLPVTNPSITQAHFFSFSSSFVDYIKKREVKCDMEMFLLCRIIALGAMVSKNFNEALKDVICELHVWFTLISEHHGNPFQLKIIEELAKSIFVIFCLDDVCDKEENLITLLHVISCMFKIISASSNATSLVDKILQCSERLPGKFLRDAYGLPHDPLSEILDDYPKLDILFLHFKNRVMSESEFMADKSETVPYLKVLCSLTRCSRHARKRFQKLLCLDDRDYRRLPDDKDSFSGRLIVLFTDTDMGVKTVAAQLFMIISKNNVQRFIDITGYGNAAGLLYQNGTLSGETPETKLDYESSDNEDQIREEAIQKQRKKMIKEKQMEKPQYNPTTGRLEPQKPNIFEGLSNEEKEWEAHKFANIFAKLSNSALKPMAIGPDGKMTPVDKLVHQTNLPEEPTSDSD